MNSNVQNSSIINTQFEDLGLIIDATNMAAGSTVWSNWFDNVQWVRNIVILSQSDQQYDFGHERRDTTLSNSGGYFTATSTANSAITGAWKPVQITTSSNILGYSVRFGIKNSSASANTIARLRVQLLGA